MYKCWICLQYEIVLYTINETYQGISYALIIKSISNVRMVDNGMMCLACRNKLEEYYKFKMLIERSYYELNKQLRKINFTTINDINFLVDKVKTESKKVDWNHIFQNDMEFVNYKSTLISRIHNKVKTEPQNDNDHLQESFQSDSDELSHKDYSKKKKIVEQKHNIMRKQKNSYKLKYKVKKGNQICIKPIYLEDVIIINKGGRKKKLEIKECKPRLYICPYCGKKRHNLKSHLLIHTAKRKFCCDDCKKKFYTKHDLEKHIQSHLKELTFQCAHCHIKFLEKGTLNRHLSVHNDIKDFICDVCSKKFKRKSGLKRHMLIHLTIKKYVCEICNMSFHTQAAFKHHYRVHSGERPYKCELCAQPYSYKRDFNRHCLNKHAVMIDHRSVCLMNKEVLAREQSLMKDLILQAHGIKTDMITSDYFKGPVGEAALQKILDKICKNKRLIDIYL